jgi:hypothetical protein
VCTSDHEYGILAMRRSVYTLFPFLLLLLLLSSCAEQPPPIPSNAEVSTSATTPLTDVTLLVAPPLGTTPDTEISVRLIDSIAGLDIQTVEVPMEPARDGRYQAKLTVPVGSTLTYRYVRQAPSKAVEVTSTFEPVDFRILYIPGPSTIEETIAGWSDAPYSGKTGRIIGTIVNLENNLGQRELLVSAGGITTFTEADGAFRIDGLPEGLHQLTVFSADGAFLPNSQGALVAAGATTPAELRVRPANSIFVTFQLTVPEGLSQDAVVRLAGNISTLGNRFSALTGGMRVSIAHMPVLVRVDPQHYLAVLSLFAGTDLHYKYTLGDGLWNAERTAEGALFTRQIILPDEDIVLRDHVDAWGDLATPPIRFTVTVPENTPAEDQISLQLNPYQWFEPLPMWPLSTDTWYYDLYGPLEKGTEIQYRYCRNLQCGIADDADTAGLEASGRLLSYQGQALILDDEVTKWMWLGEQPPEATITAEAVTPRPGVLTGVAIAPSYHPSWRSGLIEGISHIQSLRAQSITLPLEWQWQQQNPIPLLSLDLAYNPLLDELRTVHLAARGAGMETILMATLSAEGMDHTSWWGTATRDLEWWQLWFEEYRQFALTAAETAADLGVDVLILGGKWTSPALPGGLLPNGEPSAVPENAEARWRALIGDIRARYAGRLAFELVLNSEVPDMPAFLDSVDVIVFHWQVPLLSEASGDVYQIAQLLIPTLDLLDSRTERFNRPLWISIEYASVQGGLAACPPAPDGTCRAIEEFQSGQVVDTDLSVSLEEQSIALNAVLLATHDRPSIQGYFIRGFNPAVILWDKSSSIYGKPAEDVLRYWYPRFGND